MMGGNMPENDEWTLSLLTNEEYMKMHRTSYGAHQHSSREKSGKGEIIWVSNGRGCKYTALFNTRDDDHNVGLELGEILMPDTEYTVYDIWNKKIVGSFKNKFTANIKSHGAGLYKMY